MDQAIECHAGADLAAGRVRGGRATQQDELVCLHDAPSGTQLLVLADGMGGEGAGELASAGVMAAAEALWASGCWRELAGAVFLERLCQDAHDELRRRGVGLRHGAPHSTVVALLLKGERAFWAHVGDSRLYRFRRGRLLDQTEDHSVVQARVRRGLLAPDLAGGDADQPMLLRGLGGERAPQVDHGWGDRSPDDAFVLCSDGVWEYLTTPELAAITLRRPPGPAVREALAQVLERGGAAGDNAALILLPGRGGGWRTRWRGQMERLRGVRCNPA